MGKFGFYCQLSQSYRKEYFLLIRAITYGEIRTLSPISIEQVLHEHEEDFVQHVLFDLTLVRKELNIV